MDGWRDGWMDGWVDELQSVMGIMHYIRYIICNILIGWLVLAC